MRRPLSHGKDHVTVRYLRTPLVILYHGNPPRGAVKSSCTSIFNLFEPDIELNRRLHAKGFAPEQVQEVYDLAVEKMVPMILDMAAEFQAEREIERLTAHFGGEDQWREVSRQMLSFGKKNLPPQVLQGMSASYEGIMALYKMMQSEEPMTLGAKGKSIATNAEKDLQSMMNDPKYWRDKDQSYIAKVTEGFKNL